MQLHCSERFVQFSSITFRCTVPDNANYTVNQKTCHYIFTARSSYASVVLGIVILSVRPSVCLSITCVLCGEIKEHTPDILIPHERLITLVFWHLQRLVGDIPFSLKFAFEVTHPSLKNANFNQYLLMTSDPQVLAKNVQLSRIWSRLRSIQPAIDEVRTLPLTPQRVVRKANLSSLWIKFKFNRIKSVTKFLYVKTFSSSVVEEPFPYLMVYRYWR